MIAAGRGLRGTFWERRSTDGVGERASNKNNEEEERDVSAVKGRRWEADDSSGLTLFTRRVLPHTGSRGVQSINQSHTRPVEFVTFVVVHVSCLLFRLLLSISSAARSPGVLRKRKPQCFLTLSKTQKYSYERAETFCFTKAHTEKQNESNPSLKAK